MTSMKIRGLPHNTRLGMFNPIKRRLFYYMMYVVWSIQYENPFFFFLWIISTHLLLLLLLFFKIKIITIKIGHTHACSVFITFFYFLIHNIEWVSLVLQRDNLFLFHFFFQTQHPNESGSCVCVCMCVRVWGWERVSKQREGIKNKNKKIKEERKRKKERKRGKEGF